MSDRAWKQLEREAAVLFGGRRFPANSGAALDFESSHWVGQVKGVKRLSLAELTRLVEAVEKQAAAKGKLGAVVCKVPRGRGKVSPTLVIVTSDTWRRAKKDEAIEALWAWAREAWEFIEEDTGSLLRRIDQNHALLARAPEGIK